MLKNTNHYDSLSDNRDEEETIPSNAGVSDCMYSTCFYSHVIKQNYTCLGNGGGYH